MLIIFVLTLITVYSYGFVHETAHWTACKIIGLNGNITIDLIKDPPLYMANCEGINEQTNFSKFLFWGFPYIVSLVIMVLFLIFLDKEKFYLLGFPLGIFFNDAMNIFGLYSWTYKTGNTGNDLLNILLKTPKVYYIIIAIVLTLTFLFFLMNIFSFYKKLYTNARNHHKNSISK